MRKALCALVVLGALLAAPAALADKGAAYVTSATSCPGVLEDNFITSGEPINVWVNVSDSPSLVFTIWDRNTQVVTQTSLSGPLCSSGKWQLYSTGLYGSSLYGNEKNHFGQESFTLYVGYSCGCLLGGDSFLVVPTGQ
jgi:hypothetical protein